MLNIDILNGTRPRFLNFDLEDYVSVPTPPSGSATNCQGITIPTVDESAVACNGVEASTDCVTTPIAFNFFQIGVGNTLTTALTKISDKVKAIYNSLTDYVKYTDLPLYANDAAAATGGLASGKPYKDTLGYLRIKL
jgi:hypothetical protein